MENSYLEYRFTVNPVQPGTDILIAELGEAGFESFVETEDGVLAYIKKADWRESMVQNLRVLHGSSFDIGYSAKEIAQQNWNAVWEASFDPIQVGDDCVVRAPFHEKPQVRYDIVIEPKMSFGTGHHETTHLMITHMLHNDFKGKSVLDMGSGTGVLAILAAMKGATTVNAMDIDHWCYVNALENIRRNNCGHIKVYEGDATLLGKRTYDTILANINRNILLADIPTYVACLRPSGSLFLSGFYTEDVSRIAKKCAEAGMMLKSRLQKNNWVALHFNVLK